MKLHQGYLQIPLRSLPNRFARHYLSKDYPFPNPINNLFNCNFAHIKQMTTII